MSDPLAERLRAAGCVFAEDEAALLAGAFTGDTLEAATARREAGEPLEWILGRVHFGGADYRISPGVFIPRQRSQALVEAAISLAPIDPLVVDLCCGCGALGAAVQSRVGGRLVAADLDPRAVADARANGVNAVVGDLFDPLPVQLRGQIDVLLCNAPYVPTDQIALMPRDSREHEAASLVNGGPDGLRLLRRVVSEAPDWLAPHGYLVVEADVVQAATLREYAAAHGLPPQRLIVTH